jgi:hypothetical protein
MDCRSASAADCVRDCAEGAQWPNERKPIFFMQDKSTVLVGLNLKPVAVRFGFKPLKTGIAASSAEMSIERSGRRLLPKM